MISIRRFFNNPAIPQEYRRNFILLYFDIAWWGILSGTAVNFVNVYAARLGASGFQIGMLGAVPAVVSLGLSIPAGNWLSNRSIFKAVSWMAAISRLGYLLWIPLPWILGNQGQIWALVLIAFVMGIPLCGMNVGFNALFATAVPSEWRAQVVGIRNILFSITFMLSSLGAGYILDHVHFPTGYQVIFGIGFLGAALSTVNLFMLRHHGSPDPVLAPLNTPVEIPVGKNFLKEWRSPLRLDIWRTPYRKILLVFLAFHLSQFLAGPLYPLYTVNVIRLTDANIGIGTALFYLTMLLSSTQLNRLVRRIGHHKITGLSVAALCYYPIALAFSKNAFDYYVLSAIGGAIWALVVGAYINYLLEKIPENDRPSHLAWYNIILNACVLFGSLAGPWFAGYIGIGPALIIFGVLRFFAGLAVLKWG